MMSLVIVGGPYNAQDDWKGKMDGSNLGFQENQAGMKTLGLGQLIKDCGVQVNKN